MEATGSLTLLRYSDGPASSINATTPGLANTNGKAVPEPFGGSTEPGASVNPEHQSITDSSSPDPSSPQPQEDLSKQARKALVIKERPEDSCLECGQRLPKADPTHWDRLRQHYQDWRALSIWQKLLRLVYFWLFGMASLVIGVVSLVMQAQSNGKPQVSRNRSDEEAQNGETQRLLGSEHSERLRSDLSARVNGHAERHFRPFVSTTDSISSSQKTNIATGSSIFDPDYLGRADLSLLEVQTTWPTEEISDTVREDARSCPDSNALDAPIVCGEEFPSQKEPKETKTVINLGYEDLKGPTETPEWKAAGLKAGMKMATAVHLEFAGPEGLPGSGSFT